MVRFLSGAIVFDKLSAFIKGVFPSWSVTTGVFSVTGRYFL